MELPASRVLRGCRIRELRNAAGISQKLLSDRAGIYQSVISRLEAGRMDLTAFHIESLARALNCSHKAFFVKPTAQSAAPAAAA